jgi:Domain of unknown function (DUF4440)
MVEGHSALSGEKETDPMAEDNVSSMRIVAAVLLSLLLSAAGAFAVRADEAELVEAVNKSATALDRAFEKDDAAAAKALMTSDHISVAPYYGAPQSVADQLASLSDLTYEQSVLGDVSVTMLGPDVALRRFSAELEGTFKGRKVPRRVFVSAVWVKHDGARAEKFYQVTALTAEAL